MGNTATEQPDAQLSRDLAAYTEAIELNPNDASLYVKLGVVFLARQGYLNAISDFTEAINLGDDSVYLDRGSYHR